MLLLTDRVDDWLVGYLTDYEGKHLQSVAKGDLDLGGLANEEEKKIAEEQTKTLEPVIERIKQALGERISDVKVSSRLIDSPACLISDVYGMSRTMEKLMKTMGQAMPGSKPILEINPDHALINRLSAESDDARFNELIHVLYDQAVLSEGGQLDDPASFVKRLNGLLESALR